jgi:hypothetical protein
MMTHKQALRTLAKAPGIRNYGGAPKIAVVGNILYSYNTAVAVYDGGTLWVPTYHSVTTTRHINRIAAEWHADVVKLY